MKRKGIILAGGMGSRLRPSTIAMSKQLLPVYDKPMVYYPLSVLINAGIKDIIIITAPRDHEAFNMLIGNGRQWGLNIEYVTQPKAEGIAQSLILAEDFLDGSPCALILGDNLFFGAEFNALIKRSNDLNGGAMIFGYEVEDPSVYGVVQFDDKQNVVTIVEKPAKFLSKYAVTGLYFYDERACAFAKRLTKSDRGEYEITALNELYLKEGALKVELLGEGTVWLDMGTHQNLFNAAQFVQAIQARRGIGICCPEVESYRKGWIDKEQLSVLAKRLSKSGYGEYLSKVSLEG